MIRGKYKLRTKKKCYHVALFEFCVVLGVTLDIIPSTLNDFYFTYLITGQNLFIIATNTIRFDVKPIIQHFRPKIVQCINKQEQ